MTTEAATMTPLALVIYCTFKLHFNSPLQHKKVTDTKLILGGRYEAKILV